MADIPITAPTAGRRLNLLRLGFPRLAIGASLSAMTSLMGDALKLAYVDPYVSVRREAPAAPDDNLEGRDPAW
ncbi:hypothetical protein [Mesorhizobium sp. WSM4884]|uniref:hypothetical protein n=1 Tax=Mesorhizobium sp. WSM4884 TaxID=3038542 RepID=UPI002416C209|nr:hypothetical protein [Mesorhizobium sp. WSM4884]MDG4880138.1 hypothetical protein [Mesorhizobium sp. WSM4884]